MSSALIILFVFIVVFFATFVLTSALNFKKRFKEDYDMRNMFPYEFNYQGQFKDNLIGNLSIIFMAVAGIVFYSLSYKYTQYGMIMTLLICGVVASIAMPFITLLPIKFLKWHSIADALFFITTLFGGAAIGLANLLIFRDNQEAIYLVIAILGFVVAVFDLLLVLNPKVSKWANLEKVDNGNGNFSYQRPKLFPLAYTEWLYYLSYVLVTALALFTYIVIK